MSGFFGDGNGPQPPKILRSPVEQAGIFHQLCAQSTPLTLTFSDRSQRFLTYMATINKQEHKLALDELVPEAGQRLLSRGEPFRIDVYLDGVHVHWKSPAAVPLLNQHKGYTVAWFDFPEEVIYHQKRSAFRARTLGDEPVQLFLGGTGPDIVLQGQVADLSATGCKAHIAQPVPPLQPGQMFDDCKIVFPGGQVSLAVEVRHIKSDEDNSCTTLGLKFLHLDGMSQRTIERYVNHLQREARRRQEGELF